MLKHNYHRTNQNCLFSETEVAEMAQYMAYGCSKCETHIHWSNELGKCLECGNMDYKYRLVNQDCSLQCHDKYLRKVNEKLLKIEDEMTLQKMKTHKVDPLRVSAWDTKHSYGCPTCKSPMWWSVLEDKCLKCKGKEYKPGLIGEPCTQYTCIHFRVFSTRYNCRNSCFIRKGRDAIRVCRAMHTSKPQN